MEKRSSRHGAGYSCMPATVIDKGREMMIIRLSVKWLLILGTVFISVAVRRPYLSSACAALPMVDVRETKAVRQHLEENVAQLERALADLGYPIAEEDRALLEATVGLSDDDAISAIQQVLDRYSLLMVHIDDEAWFKIIPASTDPNSRRLIQLGPPGESRAEAGRGAGRGCAAPRLGSLLPAP